MLLITGLVFCVSACLRFVSPEEEQSLRGRNSTGTFTLQIVDVQDKEINLNEIPIGKKIRLRASDQSGKIAEKMVSHVLHCFSPSQSLSFPLYFYSLVCFVR